MITGRIIKAISGFFYVDTGADIYECKARNLRRDGIKPVVGDLAYIQVLDEQAKLGNLENVQERKNLLVRPAVANVDQALVVCQVADPVPSLYLLDRFLVMMAHQGIDTVICFSKADLVSEEELDRLCSMYSASYPVVTESIRNGRGVDEIRQLLADKVTTIAGPSGAGKSSLINALQPDIRMQTQEISRKLKHGKNTTRHAELIAAGGGYIIDTPGFSTMFLPDIKSPELEGLFPEMGDYTQHCRFIGCAHRSEPGCAVKEAVAAGHIAESRYESFVRMYDELKQIENTY